MIHSHRQNDVKVLLVEAEDNLHAGDLMSGAKLHGLRGTQEVHRFYSVTSGNSSCFEIKPRFFVLKQNFHRFSVSWFRSSSQKSASATTNCGEAWLVSR